MKILKSPICIVGFLVSTSVVSISFHTTATPTNVTIQSIDEKCDVEAKDTSPDYHWFLQSRKTGEYLTAAVCNNASSSCGLQRSSTMAKAKPWHFTGIAYTATARIYQFRTLDRQFCLEGFPNGAVRLTKCCEKKASQRWDLMGPYDFERYKNIATGQLLDSDWPTEVIGTSTETNQSSQLWVSFEAMAKSATDTESDNRWCIYNKILHKFISPSNCRGCAPLVSTYRNAIWQFTYKPSSKAQVVQLKTADRKLCLQGTTDGTVFNTDCCIDNLGQLWRQVETETMNSILYLNMETSQYLDVNVSSHEACTSNFSRDIDSYGSTYQVWSALKQSELPKPDLTPDNLFYLVGLSSGKFLARASIPAKCAVTVALPEVNLGTTWQFSPNPSNASVYQIKTVDRFGCVAALDDGQIGVEICTEGRTTQQWLCGNNDSFINVGNGKHLAEGVDGCGVVATAAGQESNIRSIAWKTVPANELKWGMSIASGYMHRQANNGDDCIKYCAADEKCVAISYNRRFLQGCFLHSANLVIDPNANADWAVWFKPAVNKFE